MLKTARTLYHGTTVDNKADIQRYGLIPTVGGFVEEMYGGEYENAELLEELMDQELVFLADKKGLQSAYNAIANHVARKLGKTMWEVTQDDIKKHGLLVVLYEIEDEDDYIRHRPEDDEDYYGEYPHSVEPGDYYSEEYLGVDDFLVGSGLIRFFRRYGIPNYREDRNLAIARLMNLAVKIYGPQNRKDFLRQVMGMTEGELHKKIQEYERRVEESNPRQRPLPLTNIKLAHKVVRRYLRQKAF